jgi:glycosyltransferase involved in cell wall biosynthesis
MSGIKKVVLRAPVLTRSGYGTHARQVCRFLLEKHEKNEIELFVRAVPWGVTPWLLNKDMQNGLVGKIMQRTLEHKGEFDVSIQLQLPNEWDPKLAKYNIGMTAGVETDRCSDAWIGSINQMDKVIVPTEFAKNTFLNSGKVTTDVDVVAECFDEEMAECNKPLQVDFDTSFNFLIFGQITGNNKDNDRKNIFYTIKWLCEEFAEDKDVGIILKTNMGRATKIDKRLVVNTFGKILSEIRKSPFPKLHILHGDLTNNEVAQLYRHNSVKAFVLLSRGEGFCLPMLDAAVSGVPVIAPKHSGYLDFMKHGKFIEVDYKLKEIHPSRVDNKIFVPGAKWAEASEVDFKKRVRKFKNASKAPKEWAEALSGAVKEKFSFRAVAEQYDKVLSEVLSC